MIKDCGKWVFQNLISVDGVGNKKNTAKTLTSGRSKNIFTFYLLD